MLFSTIASTIVLFITAAAQSALSYSRVASYEQESMDGHYIVVMKNGHGVNAQLMAQHRMWVEGEITLLQSDYSAFHGQFMIGEVGSSNGGGGGGGIGGYYGKFHDSLVERLAKHELVDYITPSQRYRLKYSIPDTNDDDDVNKKTNHTKVQNDAPWGLSRLSAEKLPSNGKSYSRYEYPESAGKNVNVYVIDTGIKINHEEFEGRASWGKTFVDEGDFDADGHGTHCAGTIAGKTFGVAKKANGK